MTLTILADDLTGACDTGALFAARAPIPVTVFPQPRAVGEVAVIDSESRSLSAWEARDRVRGLVQEIPRPELWFKKIDSTLRGPVVDEVEALLEATGAPAALLCPAFPVQGRTLVGRILRVHGTPVLDSALASDPDFRLSSSDVVTALGARTTRAIEWCSLEELRHGRVRIPAGAIVVCDAESDADLAALAATGMSLLPARPILVGSAGLAAALARHLGLRGEPPRVPEGARWLIVAGSRHPATEAQIEALAPHRACVLRPPRELEGDRVAVATDLARQARKVLDSTPIDLVAVTGGDTAVALYRELDADRIELLGAPLPGLALGRIRWGTDRELPLLTKAGGFGAPDLLVRLLS